MGGTCHVLAAPRIAPEKVAILLFFFRDCITRYRECLITNHFRGQAKRNDWAIEWFTYHHVLPEND